MPPLGPVVVTTPSFAKHSKRPIETAKQEDLGLVWKTEGHPLSGQDLVSVIGDAEGVIVGLDSVDRSVLESAPSLKVVAKHGVGTDNIDLLAAADMGIAVVNAPGANADGVADLTMGLLLSSARRIVQADASLRAGQWTTFFGQELRGKTLGIVGFGRIGRCVAQRAHGFGLTLVGYDPFVPAADFDAAGVRSVSLEDCVAISNFVTLHMPFGPGDQPLLTRDLLEMMPRGAGLVNAARGGLVDETALAELLHAGHLDFAALDAFGTEPLRADDPLLTAPNLVLTPHIGAFSDGANAAMGEAVVRDVAQVLRGGQPVNPVQG
ncbi:phosphoglycerate dehydrogenase [Saxibacter everestensis]|uniref:Phosphoglycerate dehydrogenase n=1 Tax=Saxibacter everestensis TaxID=2909229 RepID=A0ABY8QTQ1_9MICO|nr:phosphoglycerate dehydrogenase [Brevibacteriaceae bacterium ZFBP1038]